MIDINKSYTNYSLFTHIERYEKEMKATMRESESNNSNLTQEQIDFVINGKIITVPDSIKVDEEIKVDDNTTIYYCSRSVIFYGQNIKEKFTKISFPKSEKNKIVKTFENKFRVYDFQEDVGRPGKILASIGGKR